MRYYILFLLLLITSCSQKQTENNQQEQAKKEIEAAEIAFAQMAKDKGIAEAFAFFADSNAVIKRENDTLIKGKANIQQYYSSDFYKSAKVQWSADFTDASVHADMGYTYGKYVWISTDSSGKESTFNGVFHTVWKKQTDGSWKYVWD